MLFHTGNQTQVLLSVIISEHINNVWHPPPTNRYQFHCRLSRLRWQNECLPSAKWTQTLAPIRTDSYSDKWRAHIDYSLSTFTFRIVVVFKKSAQWWLRVRSQCLCKQTMNDKIRLCGWTERVWGFKSVSQRVTLAKEISYKADILGQILVQHNDVTPTHSHIPCVLYSTVLQGKQIRNSRQYCLMNYWTSCDLRTGG